MTKYNPLPKIEEHSFYQRYKPKAVSLKLDIARKNRQFRTSFTEYVYDADGNCTMKTRPYEDIGC